MNSLAVLSKRVQRFEGKLKIKYLLKSVNKNVQKLAVFASHHFKNPFKTSRG